MSTKWGYVTALLGAVLSLALLVAGCEISGEYDDENVHVQFGNTNQPVQAKGQ